MAQPRLSWIVLGLLAIVIAFFGFHIFQAYTKPVNHFTPSAMNSDRDVPGHPMVAMATTPVYQHSAPVSMPYVPAQTEEDLRETRPVNQTPPEVYYPEPDAVDPYESNANEAYFGDNLRHPEQMMELAPAQGTGNIVSSGLGAHVTYQDGNEGTVFDPEMAQNGGEFMSGISAFDGSDGGGIGYSSL